VGYQPQYFQSNLDEFAAISESDRQLCAVRTLGNLPLIVIRHGLPGMFARMPAREAGQAEQIWRGLQSDLANLSSNSRLLVAKKSGHNILVEQPEVVIDAIRMMVDAVRKNSDGKQVQS
jgi:hypothetical protein